MIQYYSVVITKEDNLYVAHCPELDVTSQGKTVEGAEDNIKEAIELYIESFGPGEVKHIHAPLMTSVAVEVANHA